MKVILFFTNLQISEFANKRKKDTFITCCTHYFFAYGCEKFGLKGFMKNYKKKIGML
jgi:hypothetical protein